MRILYELYNLSLPSGTGIATYARNLCKTSKELGYDIGGLLHTNRRLRLGDPQSTEAGLFSPPGRRKALVGTTLRRMLGAPFGIPTVRLESDKISVQSEQWEKRSGGVQDAYVASRYHEMARLHFQRYGKSARILLDQPPDIFHTTQVIPLSVPGAKNIYTIHDLVPLRMPEATTDDKSYFVNMIRYLAQTADRIVTVSETSRDDIIGLTGVSPEKVVNTYQAVSIPQDLLEIPTNEVEDIVKSFYDLNYKDYYLFYGAIEPKKNLSRLIDAFVASDTRSPLVVVGGLGWQYGADLRKIREHKSRGYLFDGRHLKEDIRIRRLDYVPLLQLISLIRGAKAVLFPSLYEGFGLPVLEAMLLGTPVLTSKGSSLSEVAGDAAVLVDPTDTVDMMRGIRALDGDAELRAELVGRGQAQSAKFSEQAYAERLTKLYEGLL